MKFFTTDRIILLCLLAILGLAIIASQNGLGEGYRNKKTVWADYLRTVEPIVKQINYFNGKDTKLVDKTTRRECKITAATMDCIYVTEYVPLGTKKLQAIAESKKISDAKTVELLDRLMKPEVVNLRLKKTEPEIQAEIDAVLNDLINIVGPTLYNEEIPKIMANWEESNGKDTDKTQLLDDIAFFSKIGDINPAKSSELYAKVWAMEKDDKTVVAEIQTIMAGIGIADYTLKMQIRREVEFFRTNADLSEPKVAEIYAKLYADHTTAGLYKVLNDYLKTIPDYANKVTGMATSKKNVDTAYNANVPDVTYHESAEDIRARDKTVSVPVKDASGNVVNLPWDQAVTTTPRYNDPGYFRFSPSPYVPNYEDSIYLSRLTQYNDNNTQITDYATGLPPSAGGFCAANKNNTIEIETQCGKIGKDACASTSCCVLLGGSKCVAGNEAGPTMKANYSDVSVLNRDYYYYQGKCYGNCP